MRSGGTIYCMKMTQVQSGCTTLNPGKKTICIDVLSRMVCLGRFVVLVAMMDGMGG